MFMHRWVDPEFEDKEDMSRAVESGTRTEEEEVVVDMEESVEMVNNCNSREEEVAPHMEIKSINMEEQRHGKLRNRINSHFFAAQ